MSAPGRCAHWNADSRFRLAARETGCCSLFAVDLHVAGGTTTLTVAADGYPDVLAALADRAQVLAGTAK